MGSNEHFRQIDAQLKYQFGYKQEYLDSLSDEKWALLWNDLQWIIKEQNKEQ